MISTEKDVNNIQMDRQIKIYGHSTIEPNRKHYQTFKTIKKQQHKIPHSGFQDCAQGISAGLTLIAVFHCLEIHRRPNFQK